MELSEIKDRPLPPRVARKADPLISLVVPCYKESETVERFVKAVDATLPRMKLEFVFVNDGSPDDTLMKLLGMSRTDPRLIIVDLSRNFGKEAAMTAGIDAAAGDVVVPMDADLQDPPELIHKFLEKWREGYDVVYGIREDRQSDTPTKRVTAGLFYRFFNRLSETEIPRDVGDYRLMDRVVIDAVKELPERNRFMKGIFAWVGFPSVGVGYVRAERSAGETSFNYWKLWNFALEGVVSFSTLPLRVWTYAGVTVAFGAVLFATVIVIRTMIFGRDVPGYASIMTAVLLLGGIQLMSLGIIGEYLSRLFVESKQRPLYLKRGIYREGRYADADD